MRKSTHGFSVVELLIVIVVLVLAGGAAYFTYQRIHKAATTPSSMASSGSNAAITTANTASQGTTASIDNLDNQEIDSDNSLTSQFTTTDQSNAQSTNSAATNLGGAYNEASF